MKNKPIGKIIRTEIRDGNIVATVKMSKPKTGKAIMTDGDIMRAVADAEWHDTVGAVKIAIKLARQQGIAQGRAETLKKIAYILHNKSEDTVWFNLTKEELLELMAQARQQGRAETKNENLTLVKETFDNAKKQAYANGFKEGEIKGLSESITVKGKSHLSYYQQGYALGQSDLSARLMNYSKGNVVYGSSMNAKQIIKQALSEATKEGGEK